MRTQNTTNILQETTFKVLVLDDSIGIVNAVKVILSDHNFTNCYGYTDAKEAIERIRKEKIDILILDYFLEDTDGREVAKTIRQFDKEINIIIFTGYTSIKNPLSMFDDLDINGYCEKTSNFDILILQLKAIIKSIQKRNETLRLMQEKENLIKTAYSAGISDIISLTKHNVLNILNSVQVSGELIQDKVNNGLSMCINKLKSAIELIGNDNQDSKCKIAKAVEYSNLILDIMNSSTETISTHIKRVLTKASTIGNILEFNDHQEITYMKNDENIETIVNTSLSLLQNQLNGITIKKNISGDQIVKVQKSKLVYVITNVLQNSIEALNIKNTGNKEIQVNVQSIDKSIVIEIEDTGVGIEKDNIEKIFSHGYTTKVGKFGFSLHNCANYIHEMGGSISVESKENEWTKFIIKIK